MNREEQKYLIALGNLQNMAIDNTKGSKAVEICTNDIRTYVERLNNIINEYEKPLIFLKNRIQQGMSIEEQNKYSIQYVNNILKGDNK